MDFLELDESGRASFLYCPVSMLNDFDFCDFENYKHPPFMWSLWYLGLVGIIAWEKIKELCGGEGGEDGGGGEKDSPKKKEEAEKEKPEEEPQEEEAAPAEAEAEEAEAEAPAEEEEG